MILADDEIVEPDVVVAESGRVSSRGIEGAPPFIVEVLSPTRPALDPDVKARRYAAHGVGRYRIVDPAAPTLECYRLAGTAYALQRAFGPDGLLTLHELPGVSIGLTRLWLPA